MNELEECLNALRLPCRNLNRFSNDALEGSADTALCAQPQRQPSMDFYKSSSSSLNYRSSITDADYRSSKHYGCADFFLARGNSIWHS
mmetsp:Transcript_42896/g.103774  ORF Transcript_42896/g.103774 Transcript_42896/m.103774 type:complete len:88 (+) Transcript_42896:129-392(+)